MNKNKTLNKTVSFLLSFLAFFIGFAATVFTTTVHASDLDVFHAALEDFHNRYRYSEFIIDHKNTPMPDSRYFIQVNDFISADNITGDYDGNGAVLTGEESFIEWEIEISEAGLYNISVEYLNYPGKNSDIQRAVFINGQLPFLEAGLIEFPRTWVNAVDEIQVDNRGNQMRPSQIEAHLWGEKVINDPKNGYTEPLYFYLDKGINRIAFVSIREPMLIRSVKLFQQALLPTYADMSASRTGLSPAAGEIIQISGEGANRKSSPMLFPTTDNTSPAVTPYSPRLVKMNMIGGHSWSLPGQWIEWDFYVETPGLYNIAMSIKQNFVYDAMVFRRITINGEVPFEEMKMVPFSSRSNWRVETLGGDKPFEFYFPAGNHTIRMEVTIGEYADYLREMQDSVLNLNRLYRQIIMLTGTDPDLYRDYQIGRRIPGLVAALNRERENMDRIYTDLTALSGQNVQRDSVIRTMSTQLRAMYNNIDNIPRELQKFNASIGALGTWIMDVSSQPLAIDEIYIIPAGQNPPRIRNGFFARLWHEITALFFSFFIDYNTVGNVADDADQRTIVVWMGPAILGAVQAMADTTAAAGRDQANALKQLIDEDFTDRTGINVNLMLVQMDTLLPATLAGQGPDAALFVGNDLPMNYGMRRAVSDLSVFDDFTEVTGRFHTSAMVPYIFENKCFALPITQTFSMLFYRRDILAELGLTPPDTWEDLQSALSVLKENNMTFGLPLTQVDGTFAMFLFQNGGRFYYDDGSRSELDSDIAVSAFREFTMYYTDYKLPQIYDFANRFRAGEMPMGIADYSVYNRLQVFAPEIRGLWNFRMVPGTMQDNGSINHASVAGGSAAVIMERSNDKEAAWEFLKWWTSTETQVRFGREMESLMGAAARFPSANLEAFERLPWTSAELNRIMEQFEYVQGIPQVPGGYFTGRQVHNAFFLVVEERKAGPREALTGFVRYINDEINQKRTEFGLSLFIE